MVRPTTTNQCWIWATICEISFRTNRTWIPLLNQVIVTLMLTGHQAMNEAEWNISGKIRTDKSQCCSCLALDSFYHWNSCTVMFPTDVSLFLLKHITIFSCPKTMQCFWYFFCTTHVRKLCNVFSGFFFLPKTNTMEVKLLLNSRVRPQETEKH